MSTFLLNVPPELKFWRRQCSTGHERNSCMKFCPMSPLNQNPGAALWDRHRWNTREFLIQYIFKLDMITWLWHGCVKIKIITNDFHLEIELLNKCKFCSIYNGFIWLFLLWIWLFHRFRPPRFQGPADPMFEALSKIIYIYNSSSSSYRDAIRVFKRINNHSFWNGLTWSIGVADPIRVDSTLQNPF